MMVGGIDKQIYLPYQLAQDLGYFKKYGVNMQLSTEQTGGVGAETAMASGQVDMAGAWYVHTIDFQQQGKNVIDLVQLSGAPGEREMCHKGTNVTSPAQWKGKTVGVTDIGSGTDNLTRYLAARTPPTTAQYTPGGVGDGSSFLASLQHGRIVCGMTTQPTVNAIETKGVGYSAINLASTADAVKALGGVYPAAGVLARTDWVNSHKATAQKVVDAMVATMHWIATHSAADIAAHMPPAYVVNGLTTRASYVTTLAADKSQFLPNGHDAGLRADDRAGHRQVTPATCPSRSTSPPPGPTPTREGAQARGHQAVAERRGGPRRRAAPSACQSFRTETSIARSRSGSASTSISTISPPAMVKPSTLNGRPSGAATRPAAPLTSAGRPELASAANCIAPAATVARPVDLPGEGKRAGVGAQHDVGIEHGQQALEVALAGGGQEGVDDPALLVRVGVGDGGAPCTRRRARLASWRAAVGVRSTIGAISSNGTANMSCRTNARRSAGGSVSSTTSSARPTESASSASCSGSMPAALETIGSGMRTWSGSSVSSRRDSRGRSMSRHTRAVTVVSQPARFSITSASERCRRSHASWTASSASLSEPSIR